MIENRGRLKQWVMVVAAIFALVAFILLARASSNNAFFKGNYTLLVALNIILILVLMFWAGQQLFKLWRARRHGVFGSRLAIRLTLVCSSIALVPGILIYLSSIHFLGYSIESWFDVRIDNALESAQKLSQSAVNTRLNETVTKTHLIAATLADSPTFSSGLARAAESSNVEEAALFTAGGVLRAIAREGPWLQTSATPSVELLRQAARENPWKGFEEIDNAIRLRVILPLNTGEHGEMLFLQVIDSVPPDLVADIKTVNTGWRDYETIAFQRNSTKQLYRVTLTMALLMTLTVALALAIMLSERFAAPLGTLAAGTRAVAEGDFSVRQPVSSNDEMGSLTESFNAMTIQLEQAQQEREHNHRILETTRAYLESILSNLSSGVLVFDEQRRLRMVNQSASVILQTPLLELIGVPLPEWRWKAPELAAFVDILLTRLDLSEVGQWHQEANLPVHHVTRSLLIHGTRITGTAINDVIVIDDVTVVVQAQRDAAWSEVARRLAHEIKNPLTPIQLSAERLSLKLSPKLTSDDQVFLERGTQTIISQVAAMKHMVDDFAVYARKTRPNQLVEVDLCELLSEVTALYEHLRPNLHLNLPDDPVLLHCEPVRLRQVFHNLLQNAIDAQSDIAHPLYDITLTEVGNEILIEFTDNGPGFPEDILTRAFEPYVTTKAKGTGLGLAIVKKITEEHEGHVSIRNLTPHGSIITLTLPHHHPSVST